ncbi:MAG: methyl-accepting chemotaxis protein [bacterium]
MNENEVIHESSEPETGDIEIENQEIKVDDEIESTSDFNESNEEINHDQLNEEYLTLNLDSNKEIDEQQNHQENTAMSDTNNDKIIRAAFDATTVNLMICNKDFEIIYANQAVIEMFQQREETMAKRFPGFSSENLIGRNIDEFHVHPPRQRKALSQAVPGDKVDGEIVIDDVVLHIQGTTLFDDDGNFDGAIVQWNDVTEMRKQQQDMHRLKSAIDGADLNLMMCDQEFRIVYANEAVLDMFRAREAQLKNRFPGFSADGLVGRLIDEFHVNPEHQRNALRNAKGKTVQGNLSLEGVELEIRGNSIFNDKGEFQGSVVEWKDVTDQRFAEQQVERLITAASQGDFNQRIDDTALEGFMQVLASKINQLVELIAQPINQIKEGMEDMASGDLTVQLNGEYGGDLKSLQDAFNDSVKKLLTVVTEVNQATGNISTASSEISEGNTDLSQRTESQASSLEETASSMEEMTATVKQNADNAGQANTLAAGARDLAERGGDVVRQAVKAMNEINISSRKIADIIGVIDEIAFQTNLLALNAAVEAARAGEQGRGFAVVAGEVRSLAQRSAGAAKEIKTLIQDSGEKVKEGSRLVDDSGETLDQVVNAFKKVTDIIAEISAASQEQSLGINQVNKAISSMDEMTQQNAGLVEEAAAAAQSLNEQAQGLRDVMAFFETGDTYVDPREQRRDAVASQTTATQTKNTHQSSGKVEPTQSTDSNDDWAEF